MLSNRKITCPLKCADTNVSNPEGNVVCVTQSAYSLEQITSGIIIHSSELKISPEMPSAPTWTCWQTCLRPERVSGGPLVSDDRSISQPAIEMLVERALQELARRAAR